jgi:hypothetical protein
MISILFLARKNANYLMHLDGFNLYGIFDKNLKYVQRLLNLP